MSNVTENMLIYNEVRSVDETAKTTIRGGKLAGKTDINPMWRIKRLTEVFGPCGFGWRYEITKQWLEVWETDVSAFCNINLYVKVDNEWSAPIPGTGGSSFATQIRKPDRVYNDVSDECYKMALTDAISVACKALGMAADVYYHADRTKYDRQTEISENKQPQTNAETPNGQNLNKEEVIKEIKAVKSRQEFEACYHKYESIIGDLAVKAAFLEMSKSYPKS